MATPVLTILRKSYQNARIIVVCNDIVASLLQYNPVIDEILPFSKKNSADIIITQLKKRKWDLGILLTNSFSSAYQFYKAKIPIRIGFSMHYRSLLLTHPIKLPKNDARQHLVKTYKELLLPLGVEVDDSAPQLVVTDREKEHVIKILEQNGIIRDRHILVGINPGAAYGSAKCWPPEHFKALTNMLLKHKEMRLLYFGDPNGKPLVDEICNPFSHQVINLAAKTNLRELISLIQQCHLFITNDSGPMHIAAALQKPLVAIFGSTNSIKTGPYGIGTVIRKPVACSPCYLRSCPIDFRCMTSISPREVYQESLRLINGLPHD